MNKRCHPLRAQAVPLLCPGPPPLGREQVPVVTSPPNPPLVWVSCEPSPCACGPSPTVPKPSTSEGRFADSPPPRGPDLVVPEG
eukprot:1534036-Pyramimonas_sp.AAC.2